MGSIMIYADCETGEELANWQDAEFIPHVGDHVVLSDEKRCYKVTDIVRVHTDEVRPSPRVMKNEATVWVLLAPDNDYAATVDKLDLW